MQGLPQLQVGQGQGQIFGNGYRQPLFGFQLFRFPALGGATQEPDMEDAQGLTLGHQRYAQVTGERGAGQGICLQSKPEAGSST